MGDKAGVSRSINTIHTELEYLRESGVLSPPQYQSIMAQLPQPGGMPSQYVDPRYGGGQMMQQQQGGPPAYYQQDPQHQQNYAQGVGAIAKASQDPNHPANPEHPKHHEWVSKVGSKFGNAAVWGAGATMGSDIANQVFHSVF